MTRTPIDWSGLLPAGGQRDRQRPQGVDRPLGMTTSNVWFCDKPNSQGIRRRVWTSQLSADVGIGRQTATTPAPPFWRLGASRGASMVDVEAGDPSALHLDSFNQLFQLLSQSVPDGHRSGPKELLLFPFAGGLGLNVR